VPDGAGGWVTVPLPVGAGEVAVVVVLETTEVTIEVTSVVTEATTEEAAEEVGALVGAAVGTERVTPAAWQRAPAATTVSWNKAASQAPWTQGMSAVMNSVAWQIQAMLDGSHLVLPKLLRAHWRAHGGMLSRPWAETREAVKPAARAMMVVAFILIIDILILKICGSDCQKEKKVGRC